MSARDDYPYLVPGSVAAGAALDEIDRLRRWKAEAAAVIERWDSLWELLGRPGRLGEFHQTGVHDKFMRLRAENDRLRASLAALEAEWLGPFVPDDSRPKIRESTPDESLCSCGAVNILNDEVVEYAGVMHLVDGPCFPLMNADGRWRTRRLSSADVEFMVRGAILGMDVGGFTPDMTVAELRRKMALADWADEGWQVVRHIADPSIEW